MNHKIVCWGDYAIPVPEKAKWIAWDENGESYWFVRKPSKSNPNPFFPDNIWTAPSPGGLISDIAPPPQPGPWTDQLYWIGE